MSGEENIEDGRVKHLAVSATDDAIRKARMLAERGDHAQAIAAYDALLSNLGDASGSEASRAVAGALRGKIDVLLSAERYEESAAVHDEILLRFSDDPPPGRPHMALNALAGKAWVLKQLGREEEELGAHSDLIARYGRDEDGYVREKVAVCLVDQAWLLLAARRYAEAIQSVDTFVGEYADDDTTPAILVVHALVGKAQALGRLGEWSSVIALDSEIANTFGNSTHPEVVRQVAWTWRHKVYGFKQVSAVTDALLASQAMVERYGASPEVSIREAVVSALDETIRLLTGAGRLAEASTLRDALRACVGDSKDPTLMNQLAKTLTDHAGSLFQQAHFSEALGISEEIISLEDGPAAGFHGPLAVAFNIKIGALEELGRKEEADEVFHDLASRFGDEALAMFEAAISQLVEIDEPPAREQLAAMSAYKAIVLNELGRQDEALVAVKELLGKFEVDDNEKIKELVARMSELRDRLVTERGP